MGKYPRLLGGRVEAFATVVQVLKDNGVDAVRVVNLYPDVLRRRAATLNHPCTGDGDLHNISLLLNVSNTFPVAHLFHVYCAISCVY